MDGALEIASAQFTGSEERSIREAGCTQGSAASPEQQPDLVIGQQKHGIAGISMTGDFDELRIWASARSASEISSTWDRTLPCNDPALAATTASNPVPGPAAAACGLALIGAFAALCRGRLSTISSRS